MKIKVQSCHNGSFLYFRLLIPNHGSIWRENVRAVDGKWCRSVATEALDICELVYGLTRHNIRFQHG